MIITLIGSARFEPWFKVWNEVLTLAGHCVFSLSVYPSDKPAREWYTEGEKGLLDQVHKLKISYSEAVVLLNPFAYVGESTLSEAQHCGFQGTPIYPLESWGKGLGVSEMHTDQWRAAAQRYGVTGAVSPLDTTAGSFFGIMREQASFSRLLGDAGRRRSQLLERLGGFNQAVLEGKERK